MAIDPDMQPIIDAINARLDDCETRIAGLEAGGNSGVLNEAIENFNQTFWTRLNALPDDNAKAKWLAGIVL